MATTFGTRPEDTVADSRGNVLSGVVLTLYATKSDANAQTAPIATATSNKLGLWSYTDASSRSGLWARDPAGNVWAVDAEESAASLDATSAAVAGKLDAATAATTYAVKVAEQQARAATLAKVSNVGTGQWFIKRTGNDYQFIRTVGEGRCLVQDFKQVPSLPGGYLVNQLAFTSGAVPMLSQDDTLAAYTGTWTHTFLANNTTYQMLTLTGGSMNSGSAVLTVTGANFIPGDVGRRVTIPGAGPAGASLDATIASYTDATHVNMGASASTTVSGQTITVWSGYRYSVAAGATATWTSPTATALGARIVTATNGGLFKVTVDGDATRADALPTAQEKVNDGSYPNTILVANGGTLNPTDRVIDCYSTSSNFDSPIAIASGLTPAAHTLVLTSTSYTRTGASGNRAYLTGFCYATGAETPLTANTVMCTTKALNNAYSAFEYAYKFKTTGSTSDFIGSVHGYESQLSLAFSIDGVATTITDGTTVAVGNSAVITRSTECYHMDTPATVTYRVSATYTLDQRGLTVRHIDRWAVPATVANAYPAMLPQSGYVFDTAQIDTDATSYTAVAADGSRKGQVNGTAVTLWDADGSWAVTVSVPAAKAVTNNYASDYKVYIEDRAPSGSTKLNKVYFTRTGRSSGATEAVAAGDVWASEATYTWAYLPEGAAKSLPLT